MREAFYRLGTHRGRVVAGQQVEKSDGAHEQRWRSGGLVLVASIVSIVAAWSSTALLVTMALLTMALLTMALLTMAAAWSSTSSRSRPMLGTRLMASGMGSAGRASSNPRSAPGEGWGWGWG